MSIDEQIRELASRMDKQFAENEAQRRENEAQRKENEAQRAHTDKMLNRISRNFEEFQEDRRQMNRTLASVIEQLDRAASRVERHETWREITGSRMLEVEIALKHLAQTVDRFIAAQSGKRGNGHET